VFHLPPAALYFLFFIFHLASSIFHLLTPMLSPSTSLVSLLCYVASPCVRRVHCSPLPSPGSSAHPWPCTLRTLILLCCCTAMNRRLLRPPTPTTRFTPRVAMGLWLAAGPQPRITAPTRYAGAEFARFKPLPRARCKSN
jgi:hypothetical protein